MICLRGSDPKTEGDFVFVFFSWMFRGIFLEEIFNFDGIANFFFRKREKVKIIDEKINTGMITSYNSASLFGAFKFAQTIISQFLIKSWQKY